MRACPLDGEYGCALPAWRKVAAHFSENLWLLVLNESMMSGPPSSYPSMCVSSPKINPLPVPSVILSKKYQKNPSAPCPLFEKNHVFSPCPENSLFLFLHQFQLLKTTHLSMVLHQISNMFHCGFSAMKKLPFTATILLCPPQKSNFKNSPIA